MNRTPSAMFRRRHHPKPRLLRKLTSCISVVAIDTNADPDTVEYPIPANDDAIRGIELLTSLMADAVAEGLLERRRQQGRGRRRQPSGWSAVDAADGVTLPDRVYSTVSGSALRDDGDNRIPSL